MPNAEHQDEDGGLPPPGSRWGAGSSSVLPYLTKTLQARPVSAPEQPRETRPREGERLGMRESPPSAA